MRAQWDCEAEQLAGLQAHPSSLVLAHGEKEDSLEKLHPSAGYLYGLEKMIYTKKALGCNVGRSSVSPSGWLRPDQDAE